MSKYKLQFYRKIVNTIFLFFSVVFVMHGQETKIRTISKEEMAKSPCVLVMDGPITTFDKCPNSMHIAYKQFYGPPYNVPFVCYVSGKVNKITIGGKSYTLYVGENFIRVPLELELGYNNIEFSVFAEDCKFSLIHHIEITVDPR